MNTPPARQTPLSPPRFRRRPAYHFSPETSPVRGSPPAARRRLEISEFQAIFDTPPPLDPPPPRDGPVVTYTRHLFNQYLQYLGNVEAGMEETRKPCHCQTVQECPICYEELGPRAAVKGACGHSICLDCFRQLLRLTCPLCRALLI